MVASYPTALHTFTPKADGVDWVLADHVNEAHEEIIAIETELGTDVAGSMADLKTRLAVVMRDDGYLRYTKIYQEADSQGVIVYGYDDKAAEYIAIDINSAGAARLIASTKINIVSGGNVANRLGDDAGVSYLSIENASAVETFKIDSLGRVTVKNTVTQYQAADGQGIIVYGYDDQVGATVKMYLASTGVAYIEAVNNLRFQTGGDILLRAGDNLGSQYTKFTNTDNTMVAAINSLGSLYMLEKAAANSDITAYGQLWIISNTPNRPKFTDDAGADLWLAVSDGGTGGTGTAGAGNQYVEIEINGNVYKVLHDGTV